MKKYWMTILSLLPLHSAFAIHQGLVGCWQRTASIEIITTAKGVSRQTYPALECYRDYSENSSAVGCRDSKGGLKVVNFDLITDLGDAIISRRSNMDQWIMKEAFVLSNETLQVTQSIVDAEGNNKSPQTWEMHYEKVPCGKFAEQVRLANLPRPRLPSETPSSHNPHVENSANSNSGTEILGVLTGALSMYNQSAAQMAQLRQNAQAYQAAQIAARQRQSDQQKLALQQATTTASSRTPSVSAARIPQQTNYGSSNPSSPNPQQGSTMGYSNSRDQPLNLGTGQICSSDSDCRSTACYPGPDGDSRSYCLNRAKNCAWPGYDGLMYGNIMNSGGGDMICANLHNGTRAHFVAFNRANTNGQNQGRSSIPGAHNGFPNARWSTTVDASGGGVVATVTNNENEPIVCVADDVRFNVPARGQLTTLVGIYAPRTTQCYWIGS